MANVPECPLLILQPVMQTSDARVLEHNFRQVYEWSKQMCLYVDELKARIAALEAAP